MSGLLCEERAPVRNSSSSKYRIFTYALWILCVSVVLVGITQTGLGIKLAVNCREDLVPYSCTLDHDPCMHAAFPAYTGAAAILLSLCILGCLNARVLDIFLVLLTVVELGMGIYVLTNDQHYRINQSFTAYVDGTSETCKGIRQRQACWRIIGDNMAGCETLRNITLECPKSNFYFPTEENHHNLSSRNKNIFQGSPKNIVERKRIVHKKSPPLSDHMTRSANQVSNVNEDLKSLAKDSGKNRLPRVIIIPHNNEIKNCSNNVLNFILNVYDHYRHVTAPLLFTCMAFHAVTIILVSIFDYLKRAEKKRLDELQKSHISNYLPPEYPGLDNPAFPGMEGDIYTPVTAIRVENGETHTGEMSSKDSSGNTKETYI